MPPHHIKKKYTVRVIYNSQLKDKGEMTTTVKEETEGDLESQSKALKVKEEEEVAYTRAMDGFKT